MRARMDGIESAFREVITDMPYCSISVKLLCEKAGVSRKSFYKQFGGKGDVLRAIIERDVVSPEAEIIGLWTIEKLRLHSEKIEERMFQAVLNDGEFYRSLVTAPQGGRGAFMTSAVSVFHDFNLFLLERYSFKGEDWQRQYVASFFANAKARVLLEWIEGDYTVSVGEVAHLYSRMAEPFWESLS